MLACSVQESHTKFIFHHVGHEVLRLSRLEVVTDLAILDGELLLVVDPFFDIGD